jgi:hypothetical protein
MAPLPRVADFPVLNAYLRQACQQALERRVRGGEACQADKLAAERAQMLPLPAHDYAACREQLATVNPYGLVPLDTNRYSVPGHIGETVRVRAYAFQVEILAGEAVIARHERSFGQEQDVIEPAHYLSALVERPGAFEHALPMRRWRAQWPAVYETLLAELRQRWPEDGRGLREFLRILALHQEHNQEQMVAAIQNALALGAAHVDGVQLCLRQLTAGPEPGAPLDLSGHDRLAGIGRQPVNLGQYDALLSRS